MQQACKLIKGKPDGIIFNPKIEGEDSVSSNLKDNYSSNKKIIDFNEVVIKINGIVFNPINRRKGLTSDPIKGRLTTKIIFSLKIKEEDSTLPDLKKGGTHHSSVSKQSHKGKDLSTSQLSARSK